MLSKVCQKDVRIFAEVCRNHVRGLVPTYVPGLPKFLVISAAAATANSFGDKIWDKFGTKIGTKFRTDFGQNLGHDLGQKLGQNFGHISDKILDRFRTKFGTKIGADFGQNLGHDLSSSVLRHLVLPLSLQKVIAEIQDLQHSPEPIERYKTKESVLSKKALGAFFQPWLFYVFHVFLLVLLCDVKRRET